MYWISGIEKTKHEVKLNSYKQGWCPQKKTKNGETQLFRLQPVIFLKQERITWVLSRRNSKAWWGSSELPVFSPSPRMVDNCQEHCTGRADTDPHAHPLPVTVWSGQRVCSCVSLTISDTEDFFMFYSLGVLYLGFLKVYVSNIFLM